MPASIPLGASASLDVLAPLENRRAARDTPMRERRLRVHRASDGARGVDGMPVACIGLASHGLLDAPPDFVPSWIDVREHRGGELPYSDRIPLGISARTVSLAGTQPSHYASAARVAVEALALYRARSGGALAAERQAGVRLCAGHARHAARPGSRALEWTRGRVEGGWRSGYDFRAFAASFVSVTPLQRDLTAYEKMEALAQWLGK